MKDHSIIVTDADMDRLSRLARALKLTLFRDQLQLESLERTLESAEIMSSERIPRDVIRMNSRIRVLDFDTRKIELYTLVFPENCKHLYGVDVGSRAGGDCTPWAQARRCHRDGSAWRDQKVAS
jgi:hypothetical protein